MDEPEAGQRAPRPRARLRWVLALVLAVAVGAVVGGYVGYRGSAPPPPTDAGEVQVTARIVHLAGLRVPYPPYRLLVELHNAGPEPVTIENVHLQLSGFDIAGNAAHVIRLAGGEHQRVLYRARVVCDQPPPSSGAVIMRLRARTPPDRARWVTIPVSVANPSLRAGYSIACRSPLTGIHLWLTTQSVERGRDGSLAVRLRFHRTEFARQDVPEGLRFLDVTVPEAGMVVQGLPPAFGGPSIRTPLYLKFDIRDCRAARGSLNRPLVLRVALSSASGARLVYVDADQKLQDAVRRYVRERCAA